MGTRLQFVEFTTIQLYISLILFEIIVLICYPEKVELVWYLSALYQEWSIQVASCCDNGLNQQWLVNWSGFGVIWMESNTICGGHCFSLQTSWDWRRLTVQQHIIPQNTGKAKAKCIRRAIQSLDHNLIENLCDDGIKLFAQQCHWQNYTKERRFLGFLKSRNGKPDCNGLNLACFLW